MNLNLNLLFFSFISKGTASEATLVSLLAARSETLKKNKGSLDKLVMYCSDQAHSSVERAGMMAGKQMKNVIRCVI